MEVDNFVMQCIKHYDSFDIDGFLYEYKRLNSIKKILHKYNRTGELKERLLVNHIIILYNTFNDFATTMLFSYIDKIHWKAISTILVYLNRAPEKMPIGNIHFSDIGIDQGIVDKLRVL